MGWGNTVCMSRLVMGAVCDVGSFFLCVCGMGEGVMGIQRREGGRRDGDRGCMVSM